MSFTQPLFPEMDANVIDPTTNFQNIPTLVDLKEKQQIFQDQSEQKKIFESQAKNREKKWYAPWLGQGALALASVAIVATSLYLINPPLTQKKRKDELTSETQSVVWVIVICAFVFVLVMFLPTLIKIASEFIYKRNDTKSSEKD